MKAFLVIILASTLCLSCAEQIKPESPKGDTALYFPPNIPEEWERMKVTDLDWNQVAIDELMNFLELNNTRAFIILKNGKIVIENYFGSQILSSNPFDQNSQWYWASAGKSLTATLVGIAQQEGDLSISDKTSDYLGTGWTSMSPEKEALITIRNQLTMTTGLNYMVADLDCTEPSCLQYKADAGSQWYYHNAPYTLLESVVENASGISYNNYTSQKLSSMIGMGGQWRPLGSNNVFWSTARDMARFGLLILNKGKWKEELILSDNSYYEEMINSSQELNPSYGYLWWLNGKSKTIIPGLATAFNYPLSSSAPNELFAGMGKNGQFVEIIPSQGLVVVRMGEAPDGNLVPIVFHDDMWEKINAIF